MLIVGPKILPVDPTRDGVSLSGHVADGLLFQHTASRSGYYRKGDDTLTEKHMDLPEDAHHLLIKTEKTWEVWAAVPGAK